MSVHILHGHNADTSDADHRRPADGQRREEAPTPTIGNRITYDAGTEGFRDPCHQGWRAGFHPELPGGRRERRITIGSFPDWSVKAAREQGQRSNAASMLGKTRWPIGMTRGLRKPSTSYATYTRSEYLPARRATTQEDYRSLIRLDVAPGPGS